MPLQVRVGGAWKLITAMKVFKGGSWRTLKALLVYANGAWRTVGNFTPPGPSGGGGGSLTLTVSPNPCGATRTGPGTTVTTPGCTVTPSGGLAPFTYRWTVTSGSSVANSPTTATTSFTRTGVAPNSEVDEVAQCVVTDSLGVTASITVNLFFIRTTAG